MKHIFLDLGGVVFGASGRESGLIKWEHISALNKIYGHGLNLGEDLFADFLTDYNQLTGHNLAGETFLESIFDTLDFNQELVDHLRTRFHLHILSDNYRENIQYIAQRYHFDQWSERQFYSFQYGLTKSDAKLFEMVLEDLGQAAEEVILIDDDAGNLAIAASCGIRGIQFVNNQQVFNQIS